MVAFKRGGTSEHKANITYVGQKSPNELKSSHINPIDIDFIDDAFKKPLLDLL